MASNFNRTSLCFALISGLALAGCSSTPIQPMAAAPLLSMHTLSGTTTTAAPIRVTQVGNGNVTAIDTGAPCPDPTTGPVRVTQVANFNFADVDGATGPIRVRQVGNFNFFGN